VQENATSHKGNFLMTALKDAISKQLVTYAMWSPGYPCLNAPRTLKDTVCVNNPHFWQQMEHNIWTETANSSKHELC